MRHALPSVLPWCMVYHFNTRVFATAALITCWRQCQLDAEDDALRDVIRENAIVNSVVEFHLQNSNTCVFNERCFFFVV